MSVSLNVLYLNLVEDLSRFLPTSLPEQGKGVSDWPDMTTKEKAALSLVQSIFKKYEGRTNANADKAALDLFLQSNIDSGNWSLRLETLKDEILVGEFKNSLYQFFEPQGESLVYDFHDLFRHGRTGPGASLLVNGTDFYTKLFSSELSCTSKSLYGAYTNCFELYEEWSNAEKHRLEHFEEYQLVPGNRVSFAPKNVDISRLICVEPNLNMFFQLGLGRIIEMRLKSYFGIDISNQPDKNRELARIGSEDGSFSTIDLSSASDSVSLKLVDSCLPKSITQWLHILRSPYMTLPDGSQVKLNMVSTMGNGFTFALQTAIFACVVEAAARVHSYSLRRPRGLSLGNFGVFGDDIICHKEISSGVLRLLKLLGFKVNSSKSFVEGPFRESCGYDYFNGHNVRGVYLKRLQTQESRYVAINRLNAWTAQTGISLPCTVQYLLSTVRYLPVPLWENDDAGVKVPFSMVEGLRHDKTLMSIIYRRRVIVPGKLKINEGDIKVPRGFKPRIYNSSGLLLAFLNGSITNGTINIRLGVYKYRSKLALAPNWDLTHPVTPKGVTDRWLLNRAVRLNIV